MTYATPVLLELVRAEAGERSEFVLAVGVIPRGEPDVFVGASAAALEPGDPHYANGSYDGPWTGEAVLSAAAAELLDARRGTELRVAGISGEANRTLAVVAMSEDRGSTASGLPVAVVHLSELQALSGAAADDAADQILVKTSRPGVRADLEGVYPRTLVLSRSGLVARGVLDSELPLAVAVTAFVVALVVGTLSAASTTGLAVAADARNRALLAALGFSGRSRAGLICAQALVVALAGGVLGAALGAAGSVAVNAAATRALDAPPVARFHPALAGYGVGVALLIGLATLPYLLFVSRRTTTIEDLRE